MCNLHCITLFALVLHILHSFFSQSELTELSNFFVYFFAFSFPIVRHFETFMQTSPVYQILAKTRFIHQHDGVRGSLVSHVIKLPSFA